MAVKNVQLRVEEGLKKKAERVLDDLGLDMPTAFRLFLKKLVRLRAIPFAVSVDDEGDDRFTSAQIKDILASREEARDPKNCAGPFDTAADMIAELHKTTARG